LVVAVSFRTADIKDEALQTELFILGLIALLLFAASAVQRATLKLDRGVRIGIALMAYAVVGAAGGAVAALGPWQPANQQNLFLALLLPVAVPVAAIALSSAVGLGNANLEIVTRIRAVETDITNFEHALERERHEIRGQVAALTHGPLRGRLAACAMALNFHSAEIATSPPERTAFIIAGVREHLADVLDELDSMH
jgi:hypothetical protein